MFPGSSCISEYAYRAALLYVLYDRHVTAQDARKHDDLMPSYGLADIIIAAVCFAYKSWLC